MDSEILEYVKKSRLTYDEAAQFYKRYKKRFLTEEILKNRLNILYGLRGVGKTTMMMQTYLQSPESKRAYFHALEINLKRLRISEIIESAVYLFGNDVHIFIDEINQITDWYKEITLAYDKYPKISFLITGSSSINLLSSKSYLARRANYFHVKPLSFREYVYLKYGVLLDKFVPENDLLKAIIRYDIYIKEKLKDVNLLDLVNEYVENNLPYLFEEKKETLMDLVEKAIFLDIAKLTNFESETLAKMERLILLLSASNKITYEGISKDLGISKSVVSQMLDYMEQTDLIRRVYPYKKGKSVVRKEWKYYFNVPSIRKVYAEKLVIPESDIRGNMLEDIFASNFDDIYFSDVDFVYKDMLIEVGSRSKGFDQVNKEKDVALKQLKKIVVYLGLSVSENNGAVKIPFYIFFSLI